MAQLDDRELDALDCLVQHFESFRRQAANDEQASFGKPCYNCQHYDECHLNWFSRMEPLLKYARTKL
jgi:hypothetical protein